jgi:hypothetical protein
MAYIHIFNLLLLLLATLVHSFRPEFTLHAVARPLPRLYSIPPWSNDDVPPEERMHDSEPASAIDWDEEWKKVVSNKMPVERPKGDYKSDAEIAAIKAVNAATKQATSASEQMKNTFDDVKDDWKVGTILVNKSWVYNKQGQIRLKLLIPFYLGLDWSAFGFEFWHGAVDGATDT